MGNPGLFFTAYAITLILARGFTGQLSDRFGRAAVIAPGLGLAAVGLWLLAAASSLAAFLAGMARQREREPFPSPAGRRLG